MRSGGMAVLLVCACACLATLTPGRARAQYVEGRASVMLAGGYTALVADKGAPAALSFSAPILSVAPSLAGLLETARTRQTALYALTLTAPLAGLPGAVANRLDYQGRFEVGSMSTLNLVATVSEGPLNGFVASTDPAQTPLQTLSAGTGVLFTASLRESWAQELPARMVFGQTTAVSFGDPMGGSTLVPKSLAVHNGFLLGRHLERDTLSLSADVGVDRFTAADVGVLGAPDILPAHTELVDTFAFLWTRTLSETWSSSASVGLVHAVSIDGPTGHRVQPIGSATVTYRRELATLMAGYAHQAGMNLSDGTETFSDQLQARASLPLGQTGLFSSFTLGFSHITPLDADLTSASASNVVVADAGFLYFPTRIPWLTAGLRGQIHRQSASTATANAVTGAVDPGSSFGFTRYSATLSVSFSFPRATAALIQPNLGVFAPMPMAEVLEPPPSAPLGGPDGYQNGALGNGTAPPDEP